MTDHRGWRGTAKRLCLPWNQGSVVPPLCELFDITGTSYFYTSPIHRLSVHRAELRSRSIHKRTGSACVASVLCLSHAVAGTSPTGRTETTSREHTRPSAADDDTTTTPTATTGSIVQPWPPTRRSRVGRVNMEARDRQAPLRALAVALDIQNRTAQVAQHLGCLPSSIS